MAEPNSQPEPRIDEAPPTDENGIDLSLIEASLDLTVAERIERNYQARLLAEALRRAGERLYGPFNPDPETAP